MQHILEGAGYSLLQGTKPSTLGFALPDSPVALLACIYGKLHVWTDDYPCADDEALAWVSIYHFSVTGPAASLRIYYEVSQGSRADINRTVGYVPKVPLGVSWFPKDLCVMPRARILLAGPVV